MSDSLFTKRIEAAAEEAARHVFAVARQYDTSVIVWAAGETVEFDPFTERRVKPLMFKEDKTEHSFDSPSEAI